MPTIKLADYKTIANLGSGKSGKVILVESVHTKLQYAVKVISLKEKKPSIDFYNYNNLSRIQNEVKLLTLINKYHHENILEFIGMVQSSSNNYIFLEFCAQRELSPSLFRKLTMVESLSYVRQLVNGILFIHQLSIIHRDLKPSNILINEAGTLKISDFGISYKLTNDNKIDRFELSNLVGTPLFVGPELVNFNNTKMHLGFPIDYWAFGITLFYLYFDYFPFFNDNEYKLFNDTLTKELELPLYEELTTTDRDSQFFSYLLRIISALLNKDPTERLSLNQLQHDEFLLNGMSKKEVKRFLNYNKTLLHDKSSPLSLFRLKPSRSKTSKLNISNPLKETFERIKDNHLSPIDQAHKQRFQLNESSVSLPIKPNSMTISPLKNRFDDTIFKSSPSPLKAPSVFPKPTIAIHPEERTSMHTLPNDLSELSPQYQTNLIKSKGYNNLNNVLKSQASHFLDMNEYWDQVERNHEQS
ncbi:hypothetical protein LJB42_000533 [Komagataella kurtzmanii]|nr:hypothetical protein LJB42_000533 [Komagataella kurtzmanii]